jgi:hypothetical protein
VFLQEKKWCDILVMDDGMIAALLHHVSITSCSHSGYSRQYRGDE